VRALTVDALPYHDAGASTAQELGLSMGTAVAYLRELTAFGLTVDQAAGQLEFRYAASADQFLTIAKLRAARRLWSRVAEACGIGPAGAAQRQHAVTSMVMMTERDPWVNMLRTTVACLGAGVGGADAITVLPFDSALGLPDDFARRIARNTQAILLDESNLARVIDPAGGSWYVEQLTDQLARAAWDWFQQVERAGGQQAALRSGLVATRIAQNWAKRSANLARRREAITGVSEFPNLGEQPVVREPAPPRPGGGLPWVRRSEAFEALRSRSDAILAATGARPRVELVTLGATAVHTARSAFAANLFRGGGIETVLSEAAGGSKTEQPDLAALARPSPPAGRERPASARATPSTPNTPRDRRRAEGGRRPARGAGRPARRPARGLPGGRHRRLHLRRLRCPRRPDHSARRDRSALMIPDFSEIELDRPAGEGVGPGRGDETRWREAWRSETGKDVDEAVWETPEGIAVKPLYAASDLAGLDFLDTYPGIAPYLRGPYPTMYVNQPWTIRQYAGFSTAEESNAFYRRNLAAGQKGLSVAFDLATHRGYDSDHPRVAGDVGMAGVAIDSIYDMRQLFDGHPAGPDVGVDDHERRGAAGARALHRGRRGAGRPPGEAGRDHPERHPQRVHGPQHLYLPAAALDADHLRHLRLHLAAHARYNSISISGYHIQEAGATADLELAYTLADGVEYLRAGLDAGLDVDAFAPRLSFFWAIGMNFFMEIAKMRAGRLLWAGWSTSSSRRTRSRSRCARTARPPAGRSPRRTCTTTWCAPGVEAMAATQGHTQSLHTNALDEALALPTDFSARIARNTQLFLQQESGTTRVIDPWGGSAYVEKLTDALARRAWQHIQEVEAAGGMTKAIDEGIPKLRVEEAAARTQARIDSGRQPVIGVNKYRLDEDERIEVLKVDNAAVRAQQIEKLRRLRAERDEAACQERPERPDRRRGRGPGALRRRTAWRATCSPWP
jgi:methylmalonyl-CoA mutase